MILIVCIGVDGGVSVNGIAIQAPLSLTILENDRFAPETVRVAQDALNEPPYEVAVRASPILPLGVNLDENYIFGIDQPIRTTQNRFPRRTVEFQTAPPHPVKKTLYPLVIVSVSLAQKWLVGDSGNPVERAGRCCFDPGNKRGKKGKTNSSTHLLEKLPSTNLLFFE
jgi:hypothetical protein